MDLSEASREDTVKISKPQLASHHYMQVSNAVDAKDTPRKCISLLLPLEFALNPSFLWSRRVQLRCAERPAF